MRQLKIYNGRLITQTGIMHGGCILITGSTLTALSEHDIEAPNAVAIDSCGNYISLGFIDIHVHGGGGYDFMDGTKEAFLQVAKLHTRYGTTALTPTTLSCSHEELLHILDVYDKANAANTDGAAFIGLHLEGPYFAMGQRGAQDRVLYATQTQMSIKITKRFWLQPRVIKNGRHRIILAYIYVAPAGANVTTIHTIPYKNETPRE